MAVSPFAWRPCCLRTIPHPLAASPCGRLSRPRSTISQSDCRRAFGPFSPFGLAGPPSSRLSPPALPFSHGTFGQHAGGTNPGSISRRSPWHVMKLGLPPSGIRSATSTTIDFGANCPFTFVPAYCLPVYASQSPLPDTPQDSVRGCRLSFTAVAISGDMVSCAFKAQPGQIRTCPIKASGSYRRYLTTSNLSRRRVARGPAPVTRVPGPVPGACFAGPRSPRSPPFAPPAPPPVARPCSLASSLLWRSQTSRVRASSASTPRLPDADPRYSSAGQTRDLPVPAQRASTHARVLDHAGSGGGSRYRTRPCCLPGFRTRRHPGCSSFRGSMAGLCAPLPTLRRHPRECQRTAQGRCGSLLLHRGGLSPPTPCRSSRRTESLADCVKTRCEGFPRPLRRGRIRHGTHSRSRPFSAASLTGGG